MGLRVRTSNDVLFGVKFSLTSDTQYNKLITISSYVLLSYSALNFPIHTFRLLHSHSPASALTLSDFSSNTPYDFPTNSVSSTPLSFFRSTMHVFRKHP